MSYHLEVYAVPYDKLLAVPGCGDGELFDVICQKSANLIANVDQIDDEGKESCAQAIHELVFGQELTQDTSYSYGYAYGAICQGIGKWVGQIASLVGASDYFDRVDQILSALEVPVSFSNLAFRGGLIEFPEPEDCPFLGYWSEQEISASLPAIQAADLDEVDEDVEETIRDAQDWMAATLRQPGRCIVGVLS